MLNSQVPSKLNRDDDGFLDVHSIFYTIQGEGPYAGWPAIFVRLYGCNLQCPFCDTDYTSERTNISPTKLAHNVFDAIEENGWNCGLVVITGGEPFRQNLTPFVNELLKADEMYVQIETNGTLCPEDGFPWGHERLTVVCSPKTGKIHPDLAPLVQAYKYVLSHDAIGTDGLPETALAHPLGGYSHVARPPAGWMGPVYINPMDVKDPVVNQRNMQAVAATVLKHGRYIMGVQMHKLVDLP